MKFEVKFTTEVELPDRSSAEYNDLVNTYYSILGPSEATEFVELQTKDVIQFDSILATFVAAEFASAGNYENLVVGTKEHANVAR